MTMVKMTFTKWQWQCHFRVMTMTDNENLELVSMPTPVNDKRKKSPVVLFPVCRFQAFLYSTGQLSKQKCRHLHLLVTDRLSLVNWHSPTKFHLDKGKFCLQRCHKTVVPGQSHSNCMYWGNLKRTPWLTHFDSFFQCVVLETQIIRVQTLSVHDVFQDLKHTFYVSF